jgi:hypothetical protein
MLIGHVDPLCPLPDFDLQLRLPPESEMTNATRARWRRLGGSSSLTKKSRVAELRLGSRHGWQVPGNF